jgi:Zn-dependent protease with chaperone function
MYNHGPCKHGLDFKEKMIDVTTTVALNLTFLLTLGIGFLMFLGHVIACTVILMLAGAARFLAFSSASLWNRLRAADATAN